MSLGHITTRRPKRGSSDCSDLVTSSTGMTPEPAQETEGRSWRTRGTPFPHSPPSGTVRRRRATWTGPTGRGVTRMAVLGTIPQCGPLSDHLSASFPDG